MTTIDLISVINRPVDEVWEYLVNPDNAGQWMSGVLEASPTGDGSIGVGTKFQKVQRFYGWRTEMVYDTTEYEPNRKLAYKTAWGPLSYQASLTLEPIEGGIKLIYQGRGELSGFFKLTEPVFARVARKRFKKDFNTLKELVEAWAAGGA